MTTRTELYARREAAITGEMAATKIRPPLINYTDLIEAGQTRRFQHLQTAGANRLRYSISLDQSYPAQSRAKVELWTTTGWTELWTVDTGADAKCGGRRDHKEATTAQVRHHLDELAARANDILR